MELYPDAVLRLLAEGARAALGDGFLGAYLHGSLAMGHGDEWSDVDFLVLTTRDVTADDEGRLQAFHAELFADGAPPWAQRLDGSYAPVERFRRIDPERRPFLYLDNGASQLVRDAHCNTALIRHLVREHGVAIAGPNPKTVVDAVGVDPLRAEARATMAEYAAWLARDGGSFRGWDQAYIVLTLCRLLITAETGEVAGKAEAAAWASRQLDSRWHPLVAQAIADRVDPEWRGRFPARRERMDETRAFVEYVLAQR